MNSHRRLLFAAAAVALVSLATPAQAAPAPVDDRPAPTTRCNWTVDQLPGTPDAIEGWYRGCSPVGLPGSPDAIEAWTR